MPALTQWRGYFWMPRKSPRFEGQLARFGQCLQIVLIPEDFTMALSYRLRRQGVAR
jgi:hypothetical protein